MNLVFFHPQQFIDFKCGTKTTADAIERSDGQMFKIMHKHKKLDFFPVCNAKM